MNSLETRLACEIGQAQLLSALSPPVSEREKYVPESVYHLVGSCGRELVLEKPEKRQALVENIWSQLKEKGEPPSVTLGPYVKL